MKMLRLRATTDVVELLHDVLTDKPVPAPFLKTMDFEAYDGRGHVVTTTDPAKAMKFADAEAAFTYYRTQSTSVPLRDDGKPNRPLTAYTIEIVDVP